MILPIFKTWKKGGVQFIAIPQETGVFIADEDGNNYGSWMTVDGFRKYKDPSCFRLAGKVKLQTMSIGERQ